MDRRYCTRCGASVRADSRFCASCGEALRAAADPQPPTAEPDPPVWQPEPAPDPYEHLYAPPPQQPPTAAPDPPIWQAEPTPDPYEHLYAPPQQLSQPMPAQPYAPAYAPPAPLPPRPPTRRAPLVLGAVAAGLVVVGGIAVWLLLSSSDDDSATGNPHAAGPGHTDSDPTPSDPTGSDGPSDPTAHEPSDAAVMRQARAVATVLRDSTSDRQTIIDGVNAVQYCRGYSDGIRLMRSAAHARSDLVATAQGLDTSALPDGEALQTALIRSAELSLRADNAYLQWGLDSPCGSHASPGRNAAEYADGHTWSVRAERYKSEVRSSWQQIAAETGLPAGLADQF